jgi:hypothetical protein
MLMIVIAVAGVVWVAVALVVIALCAMAAAGDRALPRQTLPPRRTWRTVLSRSLMSCQSDQFATYR